MNAALKMPMPPACLALGLVLSLALLAPALAQAPKVGPNVNMVSGTRFPEGDPFLTKQNEPSIAVSSRNPRHLLGASNDFRQVQVFIAEQEDGGDAWNTLYKSVDGGTSWRSVVLGGCPLGIAACNDVTGLTAELKALAPEFSADPTVRPGPNGTFFYSFIAGIRDVNSTSNVVAVQRFVDKNNDIQRDTDVRKINVGGTVVDVLKHAEDPILPDRLNVLDHGNLKKFIDKPWNAVDIGGRAWNIGTCDLLSWTRPPSATGLAAGVSDASETVPAFSVYVAYSIFSGVVTATDRHPKIAVVSSSDCGTTFSKPVTLSHEIHASQGASIAIDPLSGTVYVVWRSFGAEDDYPSESEVDRIYMNKSTDGGRTWMENPVVVTTLIAYDQAATGSSFRTLGFPSVAVSVDKTGTSRVHVAYTARRAGVGATAPYACQSVIPKDCDARVRLTTSLNGGTTWSAPVDVDPIPATPSNPDGRGHQVQPTLTFAAGKLAISWLDQRFDQTEEILACPSGSTCTKVTDLVRTRQAMGNLDPNCQVDVTSPPLFGLPQAVKDLLGTDPPTVLPTLGACYEYRPGRPASVWTTYLTDGSLGLVRRHTIDVFAALADPADAPTFASSRVSEYLFGSTRQDSKGNFTIRQKEIFAPNLPLFVTGTAAFIGDYIDVAGQSIAATSDPSQRYKFNIGANTCTSAACLKSTTGGASPVFHVAFTDNRDVIPPSNGDWAQPTCLATEFTADPANPTNNFGLCTTPGFAGNRNQNVRSAIVAPDSVAYAYSNSKLLSASTPRGFVLTVENFGNELAGKSYRMSVSPPVGVTASFDKTSFDTAVAGAPPPPSPLLMTDVLVQPRSSATRSLWIQSPNPNARLVVQISSPAGCSGVVCSFTTEIPLNPDPDPSASQSLVGNGDGTNIDVTNNDMGSVVLSNAVLTNNVLSNDVPNTAALKDVALSNNALTNAVMSNVVLSNAALSNLQVENLNPANAALSNADLTNNVLTNAALSNVVLTNSVLSNSVLSNNALSNSVLTNETVAAAALSNAVLSNNALSNLALTNLDPANLALSNAVLSNNALSNVALTNNDPSNVVLTNAALTNAVLTNAVLSNNALSNNALSNNALSNVALSNNALSNSPLVDDLRTVEAANFDLGKNDFTSADLGASPFAQFADGSFTIRNHGNTDTTLAIKLLLRDATTCDANNICTLPDGVKLQLVMRKIVAVPTAIPPTDSATLTGRALRIGLTQFNAQVSNVGTPEVVSPDAPDLGSFLPSKQDAATLPLGAGERAYITLRAIGTSGAVSPADPFEFLRWGAKLVVADAAQPNGAAIPLIIKTLTLPTATVGQLATFTVKTAGGSGNLTGSAVCADQFGTSVETPCLPSPVNLTFPSTFPSPGSRDGTLTFTPNATGTFYLLVTVTDQSVPVQNDRQLLKVVVIKGNQTIAFTQPANGVYLTTTLVPLVATASSGLPVSFSTTSTSVCTVSGSTATIVGAGLCTITANQAGDANYNPAPPVTQSFTIAKAAQTIAFTQPANVYLATASVPLVATASSGLLVSFSTTSTSVCTVSGSTATIVGAGLCTITANQPGDANYNAAPPVTRSFTIAKAAQTITFTQPANVYLTTTSVPLVATASSGLLVSFSTTSTSVCTVSGNTATIVGAGLCTITANQAGDANYNPAPSVTRSFTISKAPQTITFAKPANVVYGSVTTVPLVATSTSGLTVSFATTSSASVCTVSGSTVTIVGAGYCSITASQAGNAIYSAAAPVTRILTILKGEQRVDCDKMYTRALSSSTFTVNATATSGLPVTLSSMTKLVCTVSGSTVNLLKTGICTIAADQHGNANINAAPSVRQPFTVTP